MGVKERREREKSETRDKILDAARELFVTEGYEGVSMRRVADKIEYSPTAIYVHFADKKRTLPRTLPAGLRPLGGSFSEFGHVDRSGRETRADRTHLHRVRPALIPTITSSCS